MKFYLSYKILAFGIVLLAAGAGAADELDQAETAYQARLAKIPSAVTPERKKVIQGYFKALSKLYTYYKDRAQLSEVLIVRSERDRIIKEQRLTKDHLVQAPPRLNKLQLQALKSLGGVEKRASILKLKIHKAYIGTLKGVLRELIQQNRLSEAVIVRDRMNAINQERQALAAALTPEKVVRPSSSSGTRPSGLPAKGLGPSKAVDVFHLDFNSVKNGAIKDRDGKRVGTVKGAHWTPRGISGGALQFSGPGDLVTIDPLDAFKPGSALTVAFWLNIKEDASKERYHVLSRGDSAARQFFFAYDKERRCEWSFHFRREGARRKPLQRVKSTTLETGVWIHLAMVADLDQHSFSYYQNGILLNQSKLTFMELLDAPKSKLYIGHNGANEKSVSFRGMIDELSIFKRALSAADIKSLHDHPGEFRLP